MSKQSPDDPHEPGGELGPAVDRILAAGARPEDPTTVVRVMQWHLLARLCVLMEDPGGGLEEEVEDIWWNLFLLDDDDRLTVPVEALLESVIETDPTGREMRPPEYFANLNQGGPTG
jgi:hypothetical protein